jgi:RsiW-degrading membrane proteinase PrsW (M82 family)
VNELTVTSGTQRVVLQPGQSAQIGRRDDCDVVVNDPRVSREHIRLSWGPQACWILENVGRGGTFVSGQPVTQLYLTQAVEARLAAPDGPAVRFEPSVPAGQPAPTANLAAAGFGHPATAVNQAAAAGQPAAAPPPAAPWPVVAGAGAPGPGTPQFGVPNPGTPGPGTPQFGVPQPGAMAGQPFWGQPQPPRPAGVMPPMPGAWALGPASQPGTGAGTHALGSILHTLIPIKTWLTDPALRQWPRLLIAVYALAPVVLLILLQNTTDLKTLGWVYCLYIAPLWALVFWWLIRPGPIGKLHLGLGAVIVAAEFILIPALTSPWEDALAPSGTSHNLIRWIYGVGLAEEVTKALPVLVLAIFLLKVRNTKLDVRMWMFLATLSGLTFGVYEASTVYVPLDIVTIAKGGAIGIPEFVERVFVDGLQHALWAGVAGFFIGLGTNYRRQRFLLWSMGIAIPAILHGLNDWSLSGIFGSDLWVWIAIQAFSVFLFLGYAASAHKIEQEVRHTPIFRGESMMIDRSQLRMPPPGER